MTPYPLADAGSDFSLRVAEPFVETDAAEARFAQRHERALLDPAPPQYRASGSLTT